MHMHSLYVSQSVLFEGVNGVNRLATKGEKILLTTDKRGKNYRLATKKLTEIYRQPTKVEIFNRQPADGPSHSDPPICVL